MAQRLYPPGVIFHWRNTPSQSQSKSSHPFIPPSPNRKKNPKSDMPEIEASDPARSPMPKNS
jgi:hypothetical protein